MGGSGPRRRYPAGIWRIGPFLICVSLALAGWPAPAAAQTPASCSTCLGLFNCDEKAVSCSAECNARLFAIDPRRAECLRNCVTTASQCATTAARDCRTIQACQ